MTRARADAVDAAVRSVSVDVRSHVYDRARVEYRDGDVVDERSFAHFLELEAEGALEGVRDLDARWIRHYADGTVRARVRIVVPETSLDPQRFWRRTIERRALDALRTGDLGMARTAYRSLTVLRPADPAPVVRLASVEEQSGFPERARELLEKARSLLGASRFELEGQGTVDLDREIERLTEHWTDALAFFSALAEKHGAPDGALAVSTGPARDERFPDGRAARHYIGLAASAARTCALLWIDDDGIFPQSPEAKGRVLVPVREAGGLLFELDGSGSWEMPLGSLDGPVRLVLLGFEPGERAAARELRVIRHTDIERRDAAAVAALRRLRETLAEAARAGRLAVDATSFTIATP